MSTGSIDVVGIQIASGLVPSQKIVGDDEMDTALLRKMAADADAFIRSFPWCTSVAFGKNTEINGGSVYKMIPPATAGASWQEQTIHFFNEMNHGQDPIQLTVGQDQVIYGGTHQLGTFGGGTVFQITQ